MALRQRAEWFKLKALSFLVENKNQNLMTCCCLIQLVLEEDDLLVLNSANEANSIGKVRASGTVIN